VKKVYVVPFFRDGQIEALRVFEQVDDAYKALSEWVDKPTLDIMALSKWPNENPQRVRDLLVYQLIDEGPYAGTIVWGVPLEGAT
jgi:hypothetical protein